MKTPIWLHIALSLVFALADGNTGLGQTEPPAEQQQAEAEPVPESPADALGRETPRGSIAGFFAAAERANFENAAEYLDRRFLPFEHRDTPPDELAREVYIVLQRALWVDLASVSRRPEGVTGDGLPAHRDRFGEIRRDDREIVLTLDRLAGNDGSEIWLISGYTVIQLLRLYEDYSYSPTVEWFAQTIPEFRFLGVESFKWAIGLLAALIVYLALYPFMRVAARVICPKRSSLHRSVRRLLTGPVAGIIALIVGGQIILDLGIGQTGRRVAEAQTLTIIFTVWIIFALLNIVTAAVGNRLRLRDRQAAVVLLKPIGTFTKIVVLVGAILLWLDNIGYDITTLLAGLGIGGVAVALTLQKPLEDLFGAITLYTQQPARVGDFCRFGDKMGTVEEIALRTTRIRTLDDTVVSLPNARFSSEYIENFSVREKIRYYRLLRLRLETTSAQLEEILEKTRRLFDSHESTIDESGRVRLKDLGKFSFVIEVHGYLATTDYAESLRIGEELNLGIIEIVAAAGARFTIPLEELTPPATNA